MLAINKSIFRNAHCCYIFKVDLLGGEFCMPFDFLKDMCQPKAFHRTVHSYHLMPTLEYGCLGFDGPKSSERKTY